jgi:uncharacterized membrane protein
VLYILLFAISKMLIDSMNPVDSSLLFPLGLVHRGFSSSDYYPIFPQIFIFLIGTWCGGFAHNLDSGHWLYRKLPPILTWPGRNSLIIYMLHQPLFYALLLVFQHSVK